MILFLGNMLSKQGFAPAMSELLSERLAKDYQVVSASAKPNIWFRFFDMIGHLIAYRKVCSVVIIDVYSTRAFWYAFFCSNIIRFLNIPYITILRGGGLPQRIKRNPKMSNAIFKYANCNVCPSSYLERAFKGNGYPLRVIPNFIELQNYPYRYRSKIRPRLFWVRSFHAIYNPVLAVEIIHELLTRFPDAKLCMVGPDKDGSLKAVLDEAERLQVRSQIEITGRLSKEAWIEKAFDYDIFINTTNFDNMPVSVLEAMALGFPVISTNVGGIPDLIDHGHNGLMVEAGNKMQFVQHIIDLVERSEKASHLSNEARLFAEKFSWEKVKVNWEHLLTDCQA